MYKAEYRYRRLEFNFKALTSRGALPYKDVWYLKIYSDEDPTKYGVGEVALFAGLSAEDRPDFEEVVRDFCTDPESKYHTAPSSLRFAWEAAKADIASKIEGCPFYEPTGQYFTSGVPINGLIWMGSKTEMAKRISDKIDEGFKCLKLKIGAINFEDELQLLKFIRKQFSSDTLELRVDANGAFGDDALDKLKALSDYQIHSIEQPVRAGQIDLMRKVCKAEVIPVALDEELIGITTDKHKAELLEYIAPQYIILKPSLCGGFREADAWITEAERLGIGWWATSALESNVGLNAISAWVSAKNPTMCQGLGTGQVFANNTPCYVERRGERVFFNPELRPVPFEKL